MEPILLIHGYSSEGKNNTAADIYGSLPDGLKKAFGEDNVRDINLSRWISLNDGIFLDDVSFAMERALHEQAGDLLESGQGFHVIIHSTGALVVRNWIRLYSPKPCPIINLIHLAGANFGSGLAHIGRGQLARWGRFIAGTGRGVRVLNELEFGSWKTIDLHLFFREQGQDMYDDYQVQEFCIIGSQIPGVLRKIPIRYIKEDSSDNTVRTSAGNLNFNYIRVNPTDKARELNIDEVMTLLNDRYDDKEISDEYYDFNLEGLSANHRPVAYTIAYETAHFDISLTLSDRIGIVKGEDNRDEIMPLITEALSTPYDEAAYGQVVDNFNNHTGSTFERAAGLSGNPLEWNPQAQYEGHAQVIFRIRDQYGNPVEHFDVMIQSLIESPEEQVPLEKCIEDRHINKQNKGTITYYFRLQKFQEDGDPPWQELLARVPAVNIEITGDEPLSDDVRFLPLNLKLSPDRVGSVLQTFRTTIVDIMLLRLPARKVFTIEKVPE